MDDDNPFVGTADGESETSIVGINVSFCIVVALGAIVGTVSLDVIVGELIRNGLDVGNTVGCPRVGLDNSRTAISSTCKRK